MAVMLQEHFLSVWSTLPGHTMQRGVLCCLEGGPRLVRGPGEPILPSSRVHVDTQRAVPEWALLALKGRLGPGLAGLQGALVTSKPCWGPLLPTCAAL